MNPFRPPAWCLALALIAPGPTRAQYWAPLDQGIPTYPGQVDVVYGDTVWDMLLAGGSFKWIGPIHVRGAAMWNGEAWDSLPAPVQTCNGGNFCSQTYEFIRYKGELYANGSFAFVTPQGPNRGFARWNTDSVKWEALECLNPLMGGASTFVPIPPQDTMYFTGYMNDLCGYPESCVFEYDGSAFHRFEPLDDWPATAGDYVGFVFKFQGQYYMTGLLTNSLTQEWFGMLRYDGSNWGPVPGFEVYAPIKDILIHDDKLYVCGYFFEATGAPGNLVAVFDGSTWSNMAGGLLYALPQSTYGNAFDLLEWNGDIYVAGQFNYAGGVAAENVARWDGAKWCGLGGTYANQLPGGSVRSLTTWRDTLYMAGGFVTVDGDTLNNVARWLGQVENCSAPIGIGEAATQHATLRPTLLDPEGLWQLLLPEEGIWTVRVFDMTGRLLEQATTARTRHAQVDLRRYARGIYSATCTDQEGRALSAKLLRP